MPNPIIDNLAAQVTALDGVVTQAIAFINGSPARIQAAIDAALAGGATASDLAPVQAEADLMKTDAANLAAAIAAQTPVPARTGRK